MLEQFGTAFFCALVAVKSASQRGAVSACECYLAQSITWVRHFHCMETGWRSAWVVVEFNAPVADGDGAGLAI